jgi:hypothetical protein
MIEFGQARLLTDVRLASSNLASAPIADLSFPDVRLAEVAGHDRAPYQVFGQPDAPYILPKATPYLTGLEPHFDLRLATEQEALGEQYCVVGFEAFRPGAFSHGQRRQLADGNFEPLSERVLSVVEAMRLKGHQRVAPNGFSLSADVAVQTAYDLACNANRGVADIAGVGAFEFARATNRGRVSMMSAMNASGKDLSKNITSSGMSSLYEAWGIDRAALSKDDKAVARAVGRRVNRELVRYMCAGVLDNLAIIKGFATDRSIAQLRKLAETTDVPIMVSRHLASTVCPSGPYEELVRRASRINSLVLPGDHSSDDNVPLSAARAVVFSSVINQG